MAVSVETKLYSRIFRWLGLCTDHYGSSDEEDDIEIAKKIRKYPQEALDALVEIRMAVITYNMSNIQRFHEASTQVTREDLRRMIKNFPPTEEQKDWWNIWLRYLYVMDDDEWNNMWIQTDIVIENILSGEAK